MDTAERDALLALAPILLIGAGITWAGSQGGGHVGGMPVFAICAVLAFAINWVVFAPSCFLQTERFFDLTGSVTYLGLVLVALALPGGAGARALLLGGLVATWAVRLGSYLFVRIMREGADRRFDALKPSLPRFLMAWTLQGLWVLLTLSCALAAMTSARRQPLDGFAVLGAACASRG